jgi:ABC-type amino acid transport substrate-binding protein
MKWLIAILSSLALGLGLGLPAAAQGAVTLRTAAQTESEPKFVAAAQAGEPVVQGICIDIFRAIEKVDGDLQFTGDQSWSPSVRIDATMQAGLLDVACGMAKIPSREQDRMLPPPLFTLHYVLVARADDPVSIASWQDVQRLPDNNVVLSLHGTGPSRQLATIPALRVDAGSISVQQNLHKLLIGRGRFFYTRLPAQNPLIRNYCALHRIRVLPAVMHDAPVYMMVGRHVPQATVQRLSHALHKLRDSGKLDRLAKKWKVSGASVTSCPS